ncbi:MAG: hypothetical protein U0236_05265 [Nitrospira sp.]
MNLLFQSIRRLMQIVMLTLLGVSIMTPVMASVRDTDFTCGTPVSEAVLESMRGGFQIDAKGPVISFGFERNVFFNEKLVSSMTMNIPDMKRLLDHSGMKPFANRSEMKSFANDPDMKPFSNHQGTKPLDPRPNEPFTFIQSGPGNSIAHDTPSLPPHMTVIQNSLDNRTIQSETVINATVEALTWARSLHLGNALSQANINAVHH